MIADQAGKKSKKTPAQKSGGEEAQHVLDWKRVWPQNLLFKVDQRTYICLINMCKGSNVKKICDYNWSFPGSNKIILLIERSLKLRKVKVHFPSSSFFYPTEYFLKTFISSRHFHFSDFFTLRNCSPPSFTMTTQPLVQNMSPTQHIQTIIIYLTSDRTSGQQPML